MFPQLNRFQGRQLAALIRSGELSGGFTVKPFPGRMPGLAYVAVDNLGLECNAGMLWPAERPLPCDPLFQHAKRVPAVPHRLLAHVSLASPGMRRDWQWPDCIDAINEMPAGSTVGFNHGDDVYGAELTTFWREP